MARRTKTSLPRPELNIVPMMDLVLNLITFFVLIANFAVSDLPPLDPPDPPHSVAQKDENPNHLVFNVLANSKDPGKAGDIFIGGVRYPADTDVPGVQLTGIITLVDHELKISPNVVVHLRCDRSVRYDEVEPLLIQIARLGVTSIRVVTQSAAD